MHLQVKFAKVEYEYYVWNFGKVYFSGGEFIGKVYICRVKIIGKV